MEGCTIGCEIDLTLLYERKGERKRFEEKWAAFLASDPGNTKVFSKRKNKLIYRSEHLIPERKDKRPPLFLVFGNPATHSVERGMFFFI